jgi:hypothetical protein
MNRNQLNKLQRNEYGYLWLDHFKMTMRQRMLFRKASFEIFGYTFPQTNNEEGC